MTKSYLIQTLEGDPLTRQDVVKLLSGAAKYCASRAISERCKEQEGDDLRLKYSRCLSQLAVPLLAALRDKELEDIEKRLEELEARKTNC